MPATGTTSTDTPGATPGRKYVKLSEAEISTIEAIWPRMQWEEETVPGVAHIRSSSVNTGVPWMPRK